VGGYGKEDAAKETGVSGKELGRTWHQAREDAASSGHLPERNDNKVSDSPEGNAIMDFISSFFGGGKK